MVFHLNNRKFTACGDKKEMAACASGKQPGSGLRGTGRLVGGKNPVNPWPSASPAIARTPPQLVVPYVAFNVET
jgi:hypothetical protein